MARALAIIAGSHSHGPGEHEFRAGADLLQRCLVSVPGLHVSVQDADDPATDAAIETCDALVVYADGGDRHPLLDGDRLGRLGRRLAAGASLGLLHYAVEAPEHHGASEVRHWIGGSYADGFSCNPIWEAAFDQLPEHPITRGVLPFSTRDEWYFSIRFRAIDATNVVGDAGYGCAPILVATPPDQVRAGPYVFPPGPYPHIIAASGRREVLMWAVERPDGGRGMGLTGGHYHANWADASFRKVVLNGLVWLAGLDVPVGGI